MCVCVCVCMCFDIPALVKDVYYSGKCRVQMYVCVCCVARVCEKLCMPVRVYKALEHGHLQASVIASKHVEV
jgi:hypothetical protein